MPTASAKPLARPPASPSEPPLLPLCATRTRPSSAPVPHYASIYAKPWNARCRPIPDAELPVATWRNNHVEVRAHTGAEGRAVRVRYTPAQALAVGTALIACAVLADQRLGGTLSTILGAFPPDTDTTAAAGAAWFGSPA